MDGAVTITLRNEVGTSASLVLDKTNRADIFSFIQKTTGSQISLGLGTISSQPVSRIENRAFYRGKFSAKVQFAGERSLTFFICGHDLISLKTEKAGFKGLQPFIDVDGTSFQFIRLICRCP